MKKNVLRTINNDSGMATLEAIPLIIVFLVLLAFSFGSFGIIHTGILNSIASRTYAFETFRHRANLIYFRERTAMGELLHFIKHETRVHAVVSEITPDNSDDN